MIAAVWEERMVPKEWMDVIIIPIPKKGKLSSSDNWQGIALSEVVGKVAARVIQGRLQRLAEKELPDSQCGFRKDRSCTDMTFVVRQLTEKALKHRMKQFTIFIDLRKAYDSVPRKALLMAINKLGVPEALIDIVRTFHEKMKAKLRIGEEILDEIEVTNGLRGCTMVPTLFNMYACVVLERWLEKVSGVARVGTYILCKLDHQLFRRSTTGACQKCLTECQFVDDTALLASSHKAAEEACRIFSPQEKTLVSP